MSQAKNTKHTLWQKGVPGAGAQANTIPDEQARVSPQDCCYGPGLRRRDICYSGQLTTSHGVEQTRLCWGHRYRLYVEWWCVLLRWHKQLLSSLQVTFHDRRRAQECCRDGAAGHALLGLPRWQQRGRVRYAAFTRGIPGGWLRAL